MFSLLAQRGWMERLSSVFNFPFQTSYILGWCWTTKKPQMCHGILMEKTAAGRVIVTPAVLAQLSAMAMEELNEESADGLSQKV
jgi:hypothetical protein